MTLSLYSIRSGSAKELKSEGYEISVGDDIEGKETINNIMRDDGEVPKFNCLYTKTEIDEKITSNNMDKLDGLKNSHILRGHYIPRILTDGSAKNVYATNLVKLYKELNINFNNISSILIDYVSGVLKGDGKVKIFVGNDEEVIKFDITNTIDVKATTFSELLDALGKNTINTQAIFKDLYNLIKNQKFDVDKFNDAKLLDGSKFNSIIFETRDPQFPNGYYRPVEGDVSRFPDLFGALFLLTYSCARILPVQPDKDLTTFHKNSLNEIALTSAHVQTLEELIDSLTTSNTAIYTRLEEIANIKTTGINPETFADMNLTLNMIDTVNQNGSYDTTALKSINNLINNISTSHRNLIDLISKKGNNVDEEKIMNTVIKTILQQLNETE